MKEFIEENQNVYLEMFSLSGIAFLFCKGDVLFGAEHLPESNKKNCGHFLP